METNRIRYLRERVGLSVEGLAKLAGVHRNQIYKLEAGERKLYSQYIQKIAKALDCYPSELMPQEWQRPEEGRLERERLEKAVKIVIASDAPEFEKFTKKKPTPEELAELIILRYDQIPENERYFRLGKMMGEERATEGA